MNLFILTGIIGPWQIILIVVLILLLFGGKKIPELMRGLGKGIKDFKKETNDTGEQLNENLKSLKDMK